MKHKHSVQAYIEDVPVWDDGSPLAGPPLSSMQWLVWSLATAGKFFEGMIVFMQGVGLPLITREFSLTDFDKGLVTAATLAGILLGALLLGGLADRLGRQPVFIGEMVLLLIALLVASAAPSKGVLIASLFVIGLSLGADYPTAHLVISESIPASIRGRLVLGAFSFQAIGAVLGTAIASTVLGSMASSPNALDAWRVFFLVPVVPVAAVIWGRLFLPESSHWLVSRGLPEKAEKQLRKLLNRQNLTLAGVDRLEEIDAQQRSHDWTKLFRGKYLRSTILTSVPWFLQDLSTYGIGIFTPVIIATAFGAQSHEHTVSALIHNDMIGARGTALIDVGFLVGIAVAILLADRWGRIPLQVTGFVGCAAGLFIAGLGGSGSTINLPLVVAGFLLFQFMTNFGPNATTYLLAGEVFPTKIRGLGAGFAAASGKVGAVLTAFFFPTLLQVWGTDKLLMVLVVTSLLGAVVTWIYRIEPKGRDMESI
ncbi:MFS transporter [Synechococcus sp. HK01-R]|uniref:MFS transporter n=1 Tax=Synechococcus sp. HK01-R TaxID=2751171 RepID=UPI0016256824|nr:MFS transporter [Synechococcus sp. HK01-R]QNG26056.1 MFS transporter [Synechococcus sp. HK01-R]